jgi:hypothetical protein
MVFFVLGFLPSAALAEEQEVERGERVRIETTAGERLTGRARETTSDALVIELDDHRGSRTISSADVSSIETRRARSRSGGAWSKAKWGALIGAVSGTTLGFQHEQVGEDGASVGQAIALGVWSGGIMGGLIGAAVGALSPGEEWVKVNSRFQLGGRDPGFSLSVTLEF